MVASPNDTSTSETGTVMELPSLKEGRLQIAGVDLNKSSCIMRRDFDAFSPGLPSTSRQEKMPCVQTVPLGDEVDFHCWSAQTNLGEIDSHVPERLQLYMERVGS